MNSNFHKRRQRKKHEQRNMKESWTAHQAAGCWWNWNYNVIPPPPVKTPTLYQYIPPDMTDTRTAAVGEASVVVLPTGGSCIVAHPSRYGWCTELPHNGSGSAAPPLLPRRRATPSSHTHSTQHTYTHIGTMEVAIQAVRGKASQRNEPFLQDVARARAVFAGIKSEGRSLTPDEVRQQQQQQLRKKMPNSVRRRPDYMLLGTSIGSLNRR